MLPAVGSAVKVCNAVATAALELDSFSATSVSAEDVPAVVWRRISQSTGTSVVVTPLNENRYAITVAVPFEPGTTWTSVCADVPEARPENRPTYCDAITYRP